MRRTSFLLLAPLVIAIPGLLPGRILAEEPAATDTPIGRPRMTMLEPSAADPLAPVEKAAKRQAKSARSPRRGAPAPPAAGPLAKDAGAPARQAAVNRGVGFLVSAQGKDGGWGREAGQAPSDVASTSIAGLALLKARPGKEIPDRLPCERQAAAFVARRIAESKLPEQWQPTVVDPMVINDLGTSADAVLAALFLAEHVAHAAEDDAASAEFRVAVNLLLEHFDARLRNEPNMFRQRAHGLSRATLAHAAVVAGRAGVPVPEGLVARLADGCREDQHLYGRSARIGCLHAAALQAGVPPSDDALALADTLVQPVLADYHGRWPYGAGGEVFMSLLFLGAMLGDAGGPTAAEWSRGVEQVLVQAQSGNGSWSGSSCINSRVFCTSSALLVMHAAPAADRVASR
jgi:hypothetical protein